MNQEHETKRRLPCTLRVGIAIGLCVVISALIVASLAKFLSVPMFIVATLPLTVLLLGLWFCIRRLNSWRNLRQTLLSLGAFATLIAMFYTAENLRGKQAWERCKRDHEAKRMSLDWNALLPPPVPDDENIFKAPRMQEWFVVRGSSELSKRSNVKGPQELIAELVVVTSRTQAAAEAADLVLDYHAPFLTMASPETDQRAISEAQGPIIPLIEMKDKPLADAIDTLARQANIAYALDPRWETALDSKGTPLLNCKVSFHWENITARQALLALLGNYGLLLLVEHPTGTARIMLKDPTPVLADNSVKERLNALVQNSGTTNSDIPSSHTLKGSRDSSFVAGSLSPIKPARIVVVVHAREKPDRDEVQKFFSGPDANLVSVEPNGTNSFRVLKSGSSDLSKRLGVKRPQELIAELVVVTSGNQADAEAADLALDYRAPFLWMASPEMDQRALSEAQAPIIPLIEMHDNPLSNAIDTMARQANIAYSLDPKLRSAASDPKGTPLLNLKVSFRWENITARRGLLALLGNYGLALAENPSSTARIVSIDPGHVLVDDSVKERLNALVQNSGTTNSDIPSSRTLKGSRDFSFVAGSLSPVKPKRIVVHAREMPDRGEVGGFFGTPRRVSVEANGTNSFRVLKSPPLYSAADYLSWSDQFEPDFDLIREALKRPYARMDGDYTVPYLIPIPNFNCIRMTSQTLADRAKCYLLTGRPEEALRELTLLHDLRHLLEGRPTGKPMTLVAAMINVAVAGVYLDTVADGFRLHAWRESDLVTLQRQLEQINLPPPVMEAFRSEPASVCRSLEIVGLRKFISLSSLDTSDPAKTWRERLTQLKSRAWDLAPQGWVYQNMVNLVECQQTLTDCFDGAQNIMIPRVANNFVHEIEARVNHPSPYNFIAAMAIPNFSRATQTMARNQSLANVALIACALERYRLAHGAYPDSLDALAPRFLEKIPHDLLGGQPLKYHLSDSSQSGGTNAGFILYSIGWNETDEGGQVIQDKGQQSPDRGDWAWPITR